MTGVPSPRGEAVTGDPMLTYVANTLDQLVGSTERGFREMRETLATQYVPRNEIDRRFDDTNLDVAALTGRVRAIEDRAIQEARDRQARLEQEARDQLAAESQTRRDRLQRIGLLASSSLALIGTATGVVLHFS